MRIANVIFFLLFINGCNSCGVLFESEEKCAERNNEYELKLSKLRDSFYGLLSDSNTDYFALDDAWFKTIEGFRVQYGNFWREAALSRLTREYQDVKDEIERAEQRNALISRFQEAYPETWQKELLKYDIKQQESRQKEDQQDAQFRQNALLLHLHNVHERNESEKDRWLFREYMYLHK